MSPGPHVPTRPLLLAGGLAPIVLWTFGAIVAFTWPGYDPVAQSISVMVHAPLGWLQTAAFWAQGLLGIAWAVGASRVIGRAPAERRLVRALLLLQAGIGFAFALLPTDPGGVRESLIARLHLATFYLYAIAMPITLLVVSRLFRADPRWARAAQWTRIAGLALIASVALVPATVSGPLEPILGLLERGYVAIPSAWQVAIAARGWRIAADGAR